jgi:hypothetical protein
MHPRTDARISARSSHNLAIHLYCTLITPRGVFSVIASDQSMCSPRGPELLSCTRGVEEFGGGNPSPLAGAGSLIATVMRFH